MTREEAAIKSCEDRIKHLKSAPTHHYGKRQRERAIELEKVKIKALRPVSREQVEKMWTGCEKCRDQANWPSWIEKGFVYCPKCGTPLTSWAWEKQVERLEALNDAVD